MVGVRGRGIGWRGVGVGRAVIEVSECFLGFGQVAGCDVDVAD